MSWFSGEDPHIPVVDEFEAMGPRERAAWNRRAELRRRAYNAQVEELERERVRQAEIEREVQLEEQMNADLIERDNLRGITAPDY